MPRFYKLVSIFSFGTNLGLIGGEYLIKLIFDMKMEIEIFDGLNFNKLKAFRILELIWV